LSSKSIMFLPALLTLSVLSGCETPATATHEVRSVVAGSVAETIIASDRTCEEARGRAFGPSVVGVQLTGVPSSVALGASFTPNAQALMSDGSSLDVGRFVRTSNTGVLGVAGSAFVALGGGVAEVRVACGSHRRSLQVTVTGGSDSGQLVANLKVVRFDGGSGPTAISNGIPLVQGAFQPAAIANLRMYVSGVEQPARIQALEGRFHDGSVRAVLVQFTTTVNGAQTASASLRLVGARPALAMPPLMETSLAPDAAALPSDATYLRSTNAAGKLPAYPLTNVPAVVATHDAEYAQLHEKDWGRCAAAWDCGRTSGYDRAQMVYELWFRTANPLYWRRASLMVKDYVTRYAGPNNGGLPPWWTQPRSVALNYQLTGESKARVLARQMAEVHAFQTRPMPNWGQGWAIADGDDRREARAMVAGLAATSVGADSPIVGLVTQFASYFSPSTMSQWIGLLPSSQKANGCFCAPVYSDGQKNFMVGMLLTSLIRYYEEVNADPRILPIVQRAADYMWENEWLLLDRGFKYVSNNRIENGAVAESSKAAPDLNAFTLPAYAWLYKQTRRQEYLDRYTIILSGLWRPMMATSGKHFDQGYADVASTYLWIQ